jgi:DNA-binding NarL/FixJ family response regulator
MKNEKDAPPTPLLQVAIFESHPMFRKGVTSALSQNWKNAAFYEADASGNLSIPGEIKAPDFIFIGLESGADKKIFQQIPTLISKFPSAKVILYDYHSDLKMIPKLLKLGIHGYLPANFDAHELSQSLDIIANGKRYINNEIVWEYLNHESSAASKETVKLSKMEEVVADYLTKGVSVSQIAKAMNRQLSTISTVKAKIFKKMQVENVVDLKEKLQADFSVTTAVS